MVTLVTGLGYIGAALARRLLELGEEVVGLENFFSTQRAPVLNLKEYGRFTLVEGSVADRSAVQQALAGRAVDTVIHLAAQASAHPDAAPIAYTQKTNFTGPRILLEACHDHGVHRVVMASSTRVYRPPLPRRLSEAAPVHVPDLVHLSHLYCEALVAAYGLSGVAVRMGIVHGVGPVMKTDERFLPVPQRFCVQVARGTPLQVATGPESLLAFVHLEDAVEGVLRARALSGSVSVVNLAAEVRTVASLAEAVQSVARARDRHVTVRYLGRRRRYAARKVASSLDATGFRPVRRIEDSVGGVLDYYLGLQGAHQ